MFALNVASTFVIRFLVNMFAIAFEVAVVWCFWWLLNWATVPVGYPTIEGSAIIAFIILFYSYVSKHNNRQ